MTRDADRAPLRIEWRLSCVECGRESDVQAHGWRADLAGDAEAEDDVEVVARCPECSRRALGTGESPAP